MVSRQEVGNMSKVTSALLVVGALVAVFLFGRSSTSSEVAKWRSAADSALREGQAFRDSTLALRTRETALAARFVVLQHDLARLSKYSDSLSRNLPDSAPLSDVRAAWRAERASGLVCRDALGTALAAWQTCGQRAALAEARAARLDSLLRVGVRVTQCRVLFIAKCPSRLLTFVLGAGAGALAASKLK